MLHKPIIEKLIWDEVFQDVLAVNPELAYIVHILDPGNALPLYRVRYPYGSLIVNEGTFYIPNPKGELVPVGDCSISSEIQEAFGYSGDRIPLGIVLNKNVESFFNIEGSSFPWSLNEAGSVLGKLDPTDKHYPARVFTISAGARSLFSIPNIGDATLHKNLKRDFNIQEPPPKNLFEQWNIFNKVLLHPEVKSGWITELIFFPVEWVKKIYHDKAWKQLQFYFLSYAWRQTGFFRNKLLCDFALSYIQHERNLKPNP
ncbi:MAG: hypothetical protein JSS53_03985, partial [Proteobacteria bacterium]|nr:hypothetical protein [Pseudomonadota bacterium]